MIRNEGGVAFATAGLEQTPKPESGIFISYVVFLFPTNTFSQDISCFNISAIVSD